MSFKIHKNIFTQIHNEVAKYLQIYIKIFQKGFIF